MNHIKTSSYHNSIDKLIFDYGLILLLSPFLIITLALTSILLSIYSGFPIFFIQKRVGKNGRVFNLIKFRTMKVGSEKLQSKYKKLNEADGPVFKIKNDPRYTKFGLLLSRTGIDELPQILNVLKGEMRLVGPRPLPVDEAEKLTKAQNVRLLVKPGITSTWIVNGHHKHTFSEWMRSDKEYVQKATILTDLTVLVKTFLIPIRYFSRKDSPLLLPQGQSLTRTVLVN